MSHDTDVLSENNLSIPSKEYLSTHISLAVLAMFMTMLQFSVMYAIGWFCFMIYARYTYKSIIKKAKKYNHTNDFSILQLLDLYKLQLSFSVISLLWLITYFILTMYFMYVYMIS